MVIQFTVAVRTYNGATRLPAILERLQQQVQTEGIVWEVLVVDNNSQDATALVIADYASRWRSNSQIRYVFEPRQGAAYARDRCVAEASSDLIGFLDDDNWPGTNWVAAAFQFGSEHPQIGAYGGNIHAHVSETPPDYFGQISYLLAVDNRGSTAYQYPRSFHRIVPIGPGLVIRKQAWLECVPPRRRLPGRSERFAASAEDIEVMSYIHTSHWEVWHNPDLEVWHHMPAWRWEREYLLKIATESGLSNYACFVGELRPYLRPFAPLLAMVYVAVRCYRLALFYLRYRNTMKTDIAAACRFNELLGKIMSPFLTPRPSACQEESQTSFAPASVVPVSLER